MFTTDDPTLASIDLTPVLVLGVVLVLLVVFALAAMAYPRDAAYREKLLRLAMTGHSSEMGARLSVIGCVVLAIVLAILTYLKR